MARASDMMMDRGGSRGGFSIGAFGIVGAVAAIVVILAAFGSWYTIDQTKRGVLLRNGAFVEIVQPGLHFKWPWIEAVYKIDMQTHTHTWGSGNASFEAYSSDQQPAHLRVSVTLHTAPDKVAEIYSRFAGDLDAAITRLISPHVNEKVKNVFGTFTAARSITDRAKLNSDATAALTAAIAYDPVFIIESVQIEDIGFSKEYIASVEQRMQAEVEVQRLTQNLARERVQADILTTQAKAKADAVRLAAQAESDAIELRGGAEAKAITAKSNALSQSPTYVGLVQAEKWDGKLPAQMVPGGTVPFLNLDRTNPQQRADAR